MIAAAVAASIVLGVLVVYGYQSQRDGLWNFAHNGKMRRFINGRWQYRPQTDDEALKYLEMSIW